MHRPPLRLCSVLLCARAPRIFYAATTWSFVNSGSSAWFRAPVALSDSTGTNQYRAVWGTNNLKSLGPNTAVAPVDRCSSGTCNMLGFQAQAGPLSGSPIFNVDPTMPTTQNGDTQSCTIMGTWGDIWSDSDTHNTE